MVFRAALACVVGSGVIAASAACGGKIAADDTEAVPSTPVPTATAVTVPTPTATPTTPKKPPPPPLKPSFPVVRAQGGPVIQHPRVQPVFFAGESLAGDIEKMLGQLASAPYWHDTASEYGVGALGVAAPIVLPAPTQTKIGSGEVESWLVTQLSGAKPALGKPEPSTLYAVFYPSTVTITLDDLTPEQGGESCSGFGGYHSEIAAGATPVGYAVIARCGGGIDEVSVTVSHEVFEWATDPFTVTNPAYSRIDDEHWAWERIALGELSDMCTFLDFQEVHVPGIDFSVQRQWSNAASREGKYPCMPHPGLPNIQAIPRAEDDAIVPDLASLDGTGTIKTKAIRLKPGETKTVDVLVYSDQPINDVQLHAESGAFGVFGVGTPSGPSFQYEFSTFSGDAGQMVELTIRAPMAGAADDLLITTAAVPSRMQMWPTLVVSGTAYTPSSPTGSLGLRPRAGSGLGGLTGSRWRASAPPRWARSSARGPR